MDTFSIIRYINAAMRRAGVKKSDGCRSADEPARVFNMAERALRSQQDSIYGNDPKHLVFHRVRDVWVASLERRAK